MSRRLRLTLLVGILVLGAWLRFAGLAWGLRHTPHMDERYFVENVGLMLAHHDLDHRYYEYPALFFYLLAPPLALAGAGHGVTPSAYLVARGVVAAFGVLNLALLYRLGSRLAGPVAALAAALFLAVSPVDVETSHMVRADVVLESFALLALLAFGRLDASRRGDLRAGALLGAAAAVKFTGLLLLPAYLLSRLLTPGPRLRGVLLAAMAALATFCVLSPYALLHARDFFEGASTQVVYHYQEQRGPSGAGLPMLLAYAAIWPKTMGWAGLALAAAGLVLVRHAWRTWLPLLALPLTTLMAFSTQGYRFERHLVPSFGVLALLAGVAIAALARRHPAAGVLLALGATIAPLAASVAYTQAIQRPSTRDRALDWLEAHVPMGSRVALAVEGLGLDPGRYEVLPLRAVRPRNRAQVLGADAVVSWRPRDEAHLAGLPVAFLARPDSPWAGPSIRVRLVPPQRRLAYRAVALAGAKLQVSPGARIEVGGGGGLAAQWGAQHSGPEWISIELARPTCVARIELYPGPGSDASGRGLRLAVARDGQAWRRIRTDPGRPWADQIGPRSQVLLFAPVQARALRVARTGAHRRAWALAGLRLDALPDEACLAPATPSRE